MRAAAVRAVLVSLALAGAAPASSQPGAGVSMGEVFHGFLAGHLHAFREEAPQATYQSASYDLDGDGRAEWLVYLNAPIWCGPHSCDLMIFTSTRDGWRKLTEISMAGLPIRVLAQRTRGWRDLYVYVSTSLAPGRMQRLAFDGTTYVPSDRPVAAEMGWPLIDRDARSDPLFEPWPIRYR